MADRSSGILLHISSLPGTPFIGDIGPAARSFAKFLHKTHQSVWQMLPIQPVGAEQGFSPYSSHSAMAGNPLLISLDLLVQEGLLKKSDLTNKYTNTAYVDYAAATSYKGTLLEKAWRTWQKSKERDIGQLEEFCDREGYWLRDFALYSVIKKNRDNEPWYKWPADLKNRDPEALERAIASSHEEFTKVMWIQMVFNKQWQQLKSYCESLKIRLLGDVPIYVAHDSADVWSNRNIFTVDENGSLTEVSGVPPDLFNDEGQLWGMPLFKWDVLKSLNYDWWMERFKKNLKWFDIIRLDHFRGFSSYWSVPSAAASAKEGEWKPGPGRDLFDTAKKVLGDTPFVAEDLGEIDDSVYQLRDDLELPGMNVLQFAFGSDMPKSPYLPHNQVRHSVTYTGTHDNNTTLGWFKDLKKEELENLTAYTGTKLTEKNVSDHLCRMAYGSVASLAILPLQDVLSLDSTARMNMPASTSGNWTWRLTGSELTRKIEQKLRQWCFVYGRLQP